MEENPEKAKVWPAAKVLTVILESNDLAVDGSVMLMVKDVLFESGFIDVVPC